MGSQKWGLTREWQPDGSPMTRFSPPSPGTLSLSLCSPDRWQLALLTPILSKNHQFSIIKKMNAILLINILNSASLPLLAFHQWISLHDSQLRHYTQILPFQFYIYSMLFISKSYAYRMCVTVFNYDKSLQNYA